MENLPLDLVKEIITRLPQECILEAKLVCKTWRDILRRHKKLGILFSFGKKEEEEEEDSSNWSVALYYGNFDDIKRKRERYSYTTDTLHIDHPLIDKVEGDDERILTTLVGSYNGLVCFTIPHHNIYDPIHICNPYTGEYFDLPRSIKTSGYLYSGFGYLYSTNEYKVVRIFYPWGSAYDIGSVQVYTLGDGRGWRDIGNIYHRVNNINCCANGAIHFITRNENRKYDIVAFDLATEEFGLLPSPPCVHCGIFDFYDISVLGGHVCLIHGKMNEFMDIWYFKKKEGCGGYKDDDSWSWSKEATMRWPQDYGLYDIPTLLGVTKSNEILYWQEGLRSYNPITSTVTKLLVEDMRLKDFEAIPHMNTNISLREMGVMSKMINEERVVESDVGVAQQ